MKFKNVDRLSNNEDKIKTIRKTLTRYLWEVIKTVFIKLFGKMSLSDRGLNVIKNLFWKKEDLEVKQEKIVIDLSEKTTELQADIKVNNLKQEVTMSQKKERKTKMDTKNKIVKNVDLIDKKYEKNMCSKDAQRKADQYFGVKIPWWDGSALATRNSYDKIIWGGKANYISYETIDPKQHKNLSIKAYIDHMEDYFHSMWGNFYDIMMESKTSPRHGHRAIGFRWTDNQIYVIDNAAKNERMRSWAVPLSYYIKNFVTHGYRINGVWNYDTKYAYNVDPKSYKDDYTNVA